MANEVGDPYFGAKLAIKVANPGTPKIRDAAINAATFGGFLSRLVVEIARQMDSVRYRLDVSSSAVSFEVRRTMNLRGATTKVDTVGVAFYVTLFKRGLKDVFDPTRIVVIAPVIDGGGKDFLPKRSLLKSPINGLRISYPPDWLWAPFSLGWRDSDEQRAETGDEEGDAMLVHFRSMLENNIDHVEFSLPRFADLVGLHPRRVQRIPPANRTSFPELKEDVRRAVALDLLSYTSTPRSPVRSDFPM
ncbi:hypothetical protein [Sedimentimonas flavescens]|uniref:hypothetical protein n=1 Tax=Sedimentimonas flavescens TaxID=2851012 RepID=UPI001C4A6732|nr:hypothetical protein [Sedimentimonas flavescens]MBW0158391.1 hypothetical protein [Sedimentimonas flavescens]